jgi:hypothetical protein
MKGTPPISSSPAPDPRLRAMRPSPEAHRRAPFPGADLNKQRKNQAKWAVAMGGAGATARACVPTRCRQLTALPTPTGRPRSAAPCTSTSGVATADAGRGQEAGLTNYVEGPCGSDEQERFAGTATYMRRCSAPGLH